MATDEPLAPERLDALLASATSTWRVVRQAQGQRGYEAAVLAGEIPTRAGSWHDVFNVLAFARFPASKQALHRRVGELQVARRERARAAGSRANDRSREEDALALIDECAVVLAGSPDALATYERVQAEPLAAIDRVIRERGIRVRVLGHALHEHLVLERPPISTTLVTVGVEGEFEWSRVDAALAGRIAEGGFPIPQRAARLPWPDPRVDAWLE
ncbi:DUF3025 domain-containing protein [Nannocystaceae bacterium ST9]